MIIQNFQVHVKYKLLLCNSGSKAHKQVELVVESPYILRDIGQLSPYGQTSSVESFHRVICFFAPKSLHFFYSAMKAR